MWDDLFTAIALLLIFEGIMPFMDPPRWRALVQKLAEQPDKVLRVMGLAGMLIRVILLFLVRGI